MNDRLVMDNYLLILKSTVEVYVHGTLESSNSKVRDILKSSLDGTMESQKETYNLMTECGWYNVNNVKSSTIKHCLCSIKRKN